jgi:hypothetical protein
MYVYDISSLRVKVPTAGLKLQLLVQFYYARHLEVSLVSEVTYLVICVCIPQYGHQKHVYETVNLPSSKVNSVKA